MVKKEDNVLDKTFAVCYICGLFHDATKKEIEEFDKGGRVWCCPYCHGNSVVLFDVSMVVNNRTEPTEYPEGIKRDLWTHRIYRTVEIRGVSRRPALLKKKSDGKWEATEY